MLKTIIIGLLKTLAIKTLEEILKWLQNHIGNKKTEANRKASLRNE